MVTSTSTIVSKIYWICRCFFLVALKPKLSSNSIAIWLYAGLFVLLFGRRWDEMLMKFFLMKFKGTKINIYFLITRLGFCGRVLCPVNFMLCNMRDFFFLYVFFWFRVTIRLATYTPFWLICDFTTHKKKLSTTFIWRSKQSKAKKDGHPRWTLWCKSS